MTDFTLITDGSDLLEAVQEFVSDYVVLPRHTRLVIAAWVMAAWLVDVWEQFPHLLIHSPEKRCGKTTLLEVLGLIVPKPQFTQNLNPAVVYRTIEQYRPTLIVDEAQSFNRRGFESSELVRELFCGSVKRNATVLRCVGKAHKVRPFRIYGPKIIAHIGKPEGVLADRCLTVELSRKTNNDKVERFLSRNVEPRASSLANSLTSWADRIQEDATVIYENEVEPLDIPNDRMADLLMPLQAILLSCDREDLLGGLKRYADSIEERDKNLEAQSWPVRMLISCREVFTKKGDPDFISSAGLLASLLDMEEEPWASFNKGEGLTSHTLGRLLGTFDIKSHSTGKLRGYKFRHFRDAWERYCPVTSVNSVKVSERHEASKRQR